MTPTLVLSRKSAPFIVGALLIMILQTSGTVLAQHRFAKRSVLQDSIGWIPQSLPIPGVVAGDAVFFDYDNDGRLDILLAGVGEKGLVSGIYRNDSAYGFVNTEANLIPIASERGMAWGDFNNDGSYDIAIEGNATPEGGYTPVSRVYRNNNGSYVDVQAPIMNLNGGSVTWVDCNNDGRLELFVCGSNDLGGSFYAKLYKQKDSTFVEELVSLPGVWGSSVAWGDYDRDGDLDVVISGYGWGMQTRLFRNDLDYVPERFVEMSSPVEGLYPFEAVSSSGVTWFDFDNDGWPDLLVTGGGYNGPVSKIYHNDQDGTFHDIGAQLLPVTVSAVAVGDYDNDGFLDIAICGAQDFTYGSNPTTKIYHNNGDGTFTDIGAKLVGTWFGSVEWGDFDKDGRLDLVVTGASIPRDSLTEDGMYLKPVTILYRNTVLVDGNTTPGMPSGLSSEPKGTSVTLTWAGVVDIETPQNAMSYNVRIGTTPGGIDVMSPLSNPMTGFRRAPKPGNIGPRTSATLRTLPPGTYYWSVQSVDNQFAASGFTPERSFTITSSSVAGDRNTPSAYTLAQNYPNPFNPKTVISYQLPVATKVRLDVYDILGRQVEILVNGWKARGSYNADFNARGVASGIYFYRLQAGAFTQTRAMVLMR